MKNFDLLQNFVDDSGNPLHGKILFTERGSFGTSYTAKKKIYNSNGTEIANPVFTDNMGKTETQVFVDGGDYSVWFFKYVGGGDMSTDVEDDNWVLVDSLVLCDVFNEVQTALDNGKMRCVDTIADLRILNPSLVSGDVKIVAVKGYSVAGDKSIVYYKLASSGTDNGGSCIQSSVNSSMYWKMMDGRNYVDVRDFGVFPDKGDSTNVGQITAAVNYANSVGKDVYFSKGNYKLNGGNYYINGNMVVDDGVSFTAKSGTNCAIRCLNVSDDGADLKLYEEDDASFMLTASVCHTIWANNNVFLNAVNTLIVDSDIGLDADHFGNPQKCIVRVNSTKIIRFKNCIIECAGRLASNYSYYFTNCEFKDSYFKDFKFSNGIHLSGCRMSLGDFVSAKNYYTAMLKNGADVVDIGGRYIDSITFESDGEYSYKIVNAHIGSLEFANDGDETKDRSIELRGCVVDSLKVYDRPLKFSAYDCSIAGCECLAQEALFSGGNISATYYAIGNAGEPCKNATLRDCIVNGKVCATFLTMGGCTASNEVSVFAGSPGDDVSFSITECTFVSNGYIKLVCANANSIAFICDNNNFVGTNIGLQIDGNTKISNYSYEGNVGKCLQKRNSISFYAVSAYDLVTQPKLNIGQSYNLPVFGTGEEKVAVSVKFNGITATYDTMQLSAGYAVNSSTYKNFVVQANADGVLCYADGRVVKPSFCTSNLESGNVYDFGGVCEIVVQVL